MSSNKKPRKAYRPRRVTANTMALASSRASVARKDDRDALVEKTRQCIESLIAGTAGEFHMAFASGAASMASSIENLRVVTGFRADIDNSIAALGAIRDRATGMGVNEWRSPKVSAQEADQLQILAATYEFQVSQVSRSEYAKAYQAALKTQKSKGDIVKFVEQLEELAA